MAMAMLKDETKMNISDKGTDKELLNAITNEGNERAFTILYDRYYKLIFKRLHSSIGDENAVSDLSQDFWMYVWLYSEHLSTYINGTSSIKGLLINIVSKRIADYFRKLSSQRIVSIDSVLSVETLGGYSSTSPDSNLCIQAIKTITRKVLDRYPDIDKKCFIYQKELGYSAAKTARILGISEANIYKKVSLMSKDLRVALEASGYLPVALILLKDLLS